MFHRKRQQHTWYIHVAASLQGRFFNVGIAPPSQLNEYVKNPDFPAEPIGAAKVVTLLIPPSTIAQRAFLSKP